MAGLAVAAVLAAGGGWVWTGTAPGLPEQPKKAATIVPKEIEPDRPPVAPDRESAPRPAALPNKTRPVQHVPETQVPAQESRRGPAIAARSGTIVWSGTLEPGEEVSVDGTRCSIGTLTRGLPGTPVTLRLTPASVRLVEAPAVEIQWRMWRVRNDGGRSLDGFIVTYSGSAGQ